MDIFIGIILYVVLFIVAMLLIEVFDRTIYKLLGGTLVEGGRPLKKSSILLYTGVSVFGVCGVMFGVFQDIWEFILGMWLLAVGLLPGMCVLMILTGTLAWFFVDFIPNIVYPAIIKYTLKIVGMNK